jgi:phage shock protein A
VVVSGHAASSLNDMINKQQEKVGMIEEDLEKLEQELVNVEAQVASRKDNSRDRK